MLHVNSQLPAGTAVLPDQHEQLWAVRDSLDFPTHLRAETDFLLGAVRQLIRGATAFGGVGRQADLRQLPSVRLSAAATRSSKSASV